MAANGRPASGPKVECYPPYAAALEFEEACKIGARFKQDAIFYVSSGTLFVSHCDHRRSLKPITQFAKRADLEPET